MKPKDAYNVMCAIENEGFAYTFFDYSDFKEIEDEEFHRLRKNMIEAAEEFAEFLGVEI